jgi:3-carboxy-cis,cis-muconate cycloisomerase
MTWVFDHAWMTGVFGDKAVAAHLSAEVQLAHMLRVEAAHSRSLGNERAARAIEAAQICPEDLTEGTAVDGLPVPELVRCLKAQISPELHGDIHRGLTSQDVMDTAFVLSLKDIFPIFRQRLSALQEDLAQLAQAHGDAPLMGRTRMQAALPITVADRIATWRMPLERHLDRLDEISVRVLSVQCGGPVGLATGGATLAAALGLAVPDKSWHAMRDGFGELASWLSLVSGSLGKMGMDISLMTQQGVDEMRLRGGGASSAMPHKQNPILAELLVTLSRYNAVQLGGMHQALIHEQERSGASWALEWMILPAMLYCTTRGLSAAQELLAQVETISA